MSKYVYLFELDSVRKTDEEIVKAQQTLYDEIVCNGKEGHEGIVNSIEISSDEFEQWIKDNKIDDGYTLGAYMLHKSTPRWNRL